MEAISFLVDEQRVYNLLKRCFQNSRGYIVCVCGKIVKCYFMSILA